MTGEVLAIVEVGSSLTPAVTTDPPRLFRTVMTPNSTVIALLTPTPYHGRLRKSDWRMRGRSRTRGSGSLSKTRKRRRSDLR